MGSQVLKDPTYSRAFLNYKSQIPNPKQIPMTKTQNPKPVYDLEKRTFQICRIRMTSILIPTFWSLII
jgi:hypothetical protein